MAKKVTTVRKYLLKWMTKENVRQSDSPGPEGRIWESKMNAIKQIHPFGCLQSSDMPSSGFLEVCYEGLYSCIWARWKRAVTDY